ncbi:ABL023Wp [Eremothecium gossypii ATCC 10895]|uniref:ABL023Wp n=1 Tax=Eremothecium gossypii (strain ATCC 10895 / CBS 109.51 / FGSC 9923 / NRRL Y-1056) TaxID=284811 RepID=Q75DP0_EREGS|nr:ABL023Wp [Eremothecium gossypii ATCC 10895]AAS50748.2 ABL023Wp [Eremothecium gossypii ATCC 10895]AEY95037.1 FABL023Wp [Eremothecium gossypii FDAG1]
MSPSTDTPVSKLGSFAAAGAAACVAVTFTNPIETVKTRLQLQGELVAGVSRLYSGPAQAVSLIYRTEGLRGLQQGLACAYAYQILLNGSRLGLYDPLRAALGGCVLSDRRTYGTAALAVNATAGAAAGMIGAALGSPLQLVKTRMQALAHGGAPLPAAWPTLVALFKDRGVRGLYQGVDAALLRTGVGSAVQLAVYSHAKEALSRHVPDGMALYTLASALSSVAVCIAMNPFDVAMTRMYHHRGGLYRGPLDCLCKTVRQEGFSALYKGHLAQLLRIAPHTILCLTLMEQALRVVRLVENRLPQIRP